MRNLTLFFLLIPCWLKAQPLPAPGPAYMLADLKIEGLQQSNPEVVREQLGLSAGQLLHVPGPAATEALKRLWRMGIFADLNLEISHQTADSIWLTLRVEEAPRLSGYRLAGLKKQDKEALEKRLGLIRGKAWTIHQQQETGRIIEAYFAEKGFYSPTVQVYTRPDGMRKGYVRLFVQVDRGTRSRISSLTLSGARSLPSRMQNRMTRMIRPWHWTQFWRKAHPSADEIRQAGQQLTLALQEQGFRDAFVKRDSLIRLPDNRFAIEIELEPGNMYYLRQIRWSGHTHLDQDSLMRLLGMETGIPYSMPAIQDRLVMNPSGQSLAGYFQEKGYLFFQAEAVESAVEGDSVDVEIRLIEGPVATIGKIIIEGNDKTSEEVIRRSLYTAPGDTFRRSAIMRSQQELMMLNYFDPEGMDVRPEPDQETGRVDLTYQVAEKSSDLFSLRGTYNPRIKDDDGNAIGGGLTGGLQLDLKNFSTRRLLNRKAWIPFPSGDGQQLSLGFEASGLAYQHYYFRFQEPWLGGKRPRNLGFNAAYQVVRTIGDSTDSGTIPLFSNRVFSTSIDYGSRLQFPDRYSWYNASLGYRQYNMEAAGRLFPVFDSAANAQIHALTFTQTFSRRSIDNPTFPTRGMDLSFSVAATPPYSLLGRDAAGDSDPAQKYRWLEYHKWDFQWRQYVPLPKKLVLKTGLEMGYLGSYQPALGTSPFERYVLGGAGIQALGQNGPLGVSYQSLRGYPAQAFDNDGEGYSLYQKAQVELRYALPTGSMFPAWVLGFAEAGNGYNGFKGYKPFDLKRSAGLGIRVQMPSIGLIGVDWGYGFDPLPGTETPSGSRFHFIFGREF